jgi:hypothetical protein
VIGPLFIFSLKIFNFQIFALNFFKGKKIFIAKKKLEKIKMQSVFIVLFISIAIALGTYKIVPEGHIGIAYKGSALVEGTLSPGIHFKVPFLTTMHPVQVTVQTDQVSNIPVKLPCN